LINYISNLPQDLRSGGFSAMNAAAFSAISKCGSSHYVGPINPPVLGWQKVWSKLRRVAWSQGSFFFFSEQRLRKIASEVHAGCRNEARLDFFHGFTPWIATMPERPYLAWSDCIFRDYVDIFHRREQFRGEDLERIEQAEAAWLRKASRVLFTSQWAAERAVRDYSLDAKRVGSVGIFGELEMPARDGYAGGKEFVFVSTNFEAKGGPIVLAAFREVRKRHPDALLTIVGDRPSDVAREEGVTFTGFLRKEIPEEYRRFAQILGGARAVVSATSSDICPLLFVEAGYVGCPVIASRKFAISEIVEDGHTGLLLKDVSAGTVADAMQWMLEHVSEYQETRDAAWRKTRTQHCKLKFEERLQAHVCALVSKHEVAARTPATERRTNLPSHQST
jgi:glycosyltransferase involved in cell wall biosynthesis